ncbi:hypothetical protein, unlikely [Trypanosoma brucei gambiense DAL972]|uniref:Uncharacterized protein n=1 Tax=Trypanosoma brucei gambiense (strain MHOM/CI/86/DAL972) TaxID=679716 RepID=D0A6V0_TRYB9|nr:hypothetical protein, unlikely [Trypanosoma brucei gambiense DAL972]CBH17401.1 hypothetical protein, unlikely [Trypanosoma brucei gambiense DAL972]|eukprot:XP_011779665.1 hypothetical protein, unlikely [Trypanosoma brucei gambiense DAL972]
MGVHCCVCTLHDSSSDCLMALVLPVLPFLCVLALVCYFTAFVIREVHPAVIDLSVSMPGRVQARASHLCASQHPFPPPILMTMHIIIGILLFGFSRGALKERVANHRGG